MWGNCNIQMFKNIVEILHFPLRHFDAANLNKRGSGNPGQNLIYLRLHVNFWCPFYPEMKNIIEPRRLICSLNCPLDTVILDIQKSYFPLICKK